MLSTAPFLISATKYLVVKDTILNIVKSIDSIPHKKVFSQENTFRVDCPFCNTHKKDKKLYIQVLPNEIKYNCFRCGTHGRIKLTKEHIDLNPKLIIEPEKDKKLLHTSNKLGIPLTKTAKQYLHSRNISDILIDKYKIVEGSIVTKYKDYIIIPIFMFGIEVYFTTRLYTPNSKKPKSLLPQTKYTIRQKATTLFNFDIAKHHKEVIIVEGVFDSIRYPNSIALLGKIISINQISLIDYYFKNTKSIVLCLDSKQKDKEIDKAIHKNITLLKKYLDKKIWVCRLPFGDPADYDTQTFYNEILPKYTKEV